MSEPRTSYETSVRLKDAGAPQLGGFGVWLGPITDGMPPPFLSLTASGDWNNSARAFTAGELIEMLKNDVYAIDHEYDTYQVYYTRSECRMYADVSLVEALAAVCLEVRPWE